MKKILLATIAMAALATAAMPAHAADKLRFAIVPKAMNNPYFDLSHNGCVAEAAKLGNVECVYIGPIEHEPATQVQIIQDLISQHIDGLAISVADAGSVTKVIQQARDAGIPVITFDSDAPDSARQAYVGTDNHALGMVIGQTLNKVQPAGGTYAMVSGGPAASNLADRVQGVRDGLKGTKWTEIANSVQFCNDDQSLAVQQMQDLATANPDIAAIVPVGGWPLFASQAYKRFVDSQKARFDAGKLSIVSADTLQVELDLLKAGYVNALIGQQPDAMGAKAMDLLNDLKAGKPVEKITYVGVSPVTKETM